MAGLFLLGFALAAAAARFSVDELMDTLAENRYGSAFFTEKKYVSILDIPVESSGELRFAPPARLEKRTLRPSVETLVLDGDTLTIERQSQKQVIQINEFPEVAGMVVGIHATLSGNRKALERAYRLALEGSRDRWVLDLKPLDAGVARVIARIRVEGVRNDLHTVEILLVDGDRSVMSVRRASP